MPAFKSKKRRKNARQYLWEYIRRNRVFKVEDLLPIVDDMSVESMKVFFKQLEHAGYLKIRIPVGRKTKPKKFVDRSYGLVKNTGALCPVWVPKQKRLFDRNNQEVQTRDPVYLPKVSKKIGQRPVKALDYAKGRIIQIIEVERSISLLMLSVRSGVSGRMLAEAVQALIEEGLLLDDGVTKEGLPLLKNGGET